METSFNRDRSFDGFAEQARDEAFWSKVKAVGAYVLDHVHQEPFPAMSDHYRPESYAEVADSLPQQLQLDYEPSAGGR